MDVVTERPWFETFLTALEQTGNVSAACTAANVSRCTAYDHRGRNPDFASAWDDALEVATDALEAEARRRAVVGWLEPVWYMGEEVGSIRKYDSGLLTLLLKAHRPGKFRDNSRMEHSGDLTIRVEYADADIDPAPHPPGAAGDPPGGAAV